MRYKVYGISLMKIWPFTDEPVEIYTSFAAVLKNNIKFLPVHKSNVNNIRETGSVTRMSQTFYIIREDNPLFNADIIVLSADTAAYGDIDFKRYDDDLYNLAVKLIYKPLNP